MSAPAYPGLTDYDLAPQDWDTIRSLGTTLGVWAHPDDEAWLSAGLMAAAVWLGLTVECATATRGEAGSHDETRWPARGMGNLRETELLASLDVIGVKGHRFLGYHDGECHLVPFEDGVVAVLTVLEDVKPDTVITFGPDGLTGHSDHRAVSAWTTEAFRRYQDIQAPHARALYLAATEQWQHDCRPPLERAHAMYGPEYPEVIPEAGLLLDLTLTGPLLELKLDAVRAHHSQITPLVETLGGLKPLLPWFSHETFRLATLPSSPVKPPEGR